MPEVTVEDTSSVEVLKERIKELEEELANTQPTPEDDSPKHVPAEFSDMFEALRKSGALTCPRPQPSLVTNSRKTPMPCIGGTRKYLAGLKQEWARKYRKLPWRCKRLAERRDWPWKTGSPLIPDS